MKEGIVERMVGLLDSSFVRLYRQAIEGDVKAADMLGIAKRIGFKRAGELDSLLHSFPPEELDPQNPSRHPELFNRRSL